MHWPVPADLSMAAPASLVWEPHDGSVRSFLAPTPVAAPSPTTVRVPALADRIRRFAAGVKTAAIARLGYSAWEACSLFFVRLETTEYKAVGLLSNVSSRFRSNS